MLSADISYSNVLRRRSIRNDPAVINSCKRQADAGSRKIYIAGFQLSLTNEKLALSPSFFLGLEDLLRIGIFTEGLQQLRTFGYQ